MDRWFLLVLVTALAVSPVSAEFFSPFNVSYDHRALVIDGQRRMLISAGIHYPRATPEMWPGLIARSKDGGADVIQTYVFWNGHEPIKGQYNFEGRYDLVKFVKLVGSSGLYLHLRIGPYVCAEWNFGGLPVWLRDIPGIEFRTNNEQFKKEMQRFVVKIVNLMWQEMLFSWQGGPIILLQIENEYGNIEDSYGQNGKEYVKWASNLAVGLEAGVPWVMCRQKDAPENIIDACNGFYCDGFRPNSYKKPILWTEDWNGWFASWGGRLPHRPVEDNAFAVARFFERGGSFHNYYMFFGGTNFGRTAGGPLQITSYDYDAPIDEYGLLTFPKWGHLKDLHAAIKLCEPALVSVDDGPQYKKLGPMQEVHVYSSSRIDLNSSLPENIGICSAFLANIDEHETVNVEFLGASYALPPWSVSILPDCKHVAFNTAKVTAQVSSKIFDDIHTNHQNMSRTTDLLLFKEDSYISNDWMFFEEHMCLLDNNSFSSEGILEHLNVTKDTSDYLWYSTRINVTKEDIQFWESNGSIPLLVIDRARDVVKVFVNRQFAGRAVGHWVRVEQPIHLIEGENELILLSETVGLQNYGAFLEKDGAGFRGRIHITGLKNGGIDLSSSAWTYQVGLMGESRKLYDLNGHENVNWTRLQVDPISSAFTWYKTTFDAPAGNEPIALYLGSMGKGQAWVNGHGIGRYWSRIAPEDGCPNVCNYRGAYNENKCMMNCGNLTQEWYHVPRSWLVESGNLLVIFEEETGGNPFKIALKLRSTSTICGRVSENDHPPLAAWLREDVLTRNISVADVPPEMQLQCDAGQTIAAVTFASYGTAHGDCRSFSLSSCHAPASWSVVSEACLGRNSCKITVSNRTFKMDPCRGILKTLAVQAKCASSLGVTRAQY